MVPVLAGFQYYRPLTGLLATLGKNKYFSGGCQYPVIMYGTGEYEQNTNVAVTRGHSITGYHKQCCGSEMNFFFSLFFSDPDPTLALISDPDSNPDCS
jgi:hypothetical protein